MSNLRIENLSPRLMPSETVDRGQLGAEQEISSQALSKTLEGHKTGASDDFANLLQKTLEQVNENQVNADHAIKELISGRTKNIHETMLAVEKAELSLKLMVQVRNKVLEAYKEVMRMQV